MDRKDWTLLTIAAAKSKALQPVQLQKALFLISKNVQKKTLGRNFYVFEPYDYGPFCRDVYLDAELLESDDLVTITRPPESRFNIYSIAPQGVRVGAKLRENLPLSISDYIDRVVEFVKNISFNELVASIYKNYPEMRENSVFRG